MQKREWSYTAIRNSDMDGVSDVKELSSVQPNGDKAIATRDHGVVQAFTDANHAVSPDDDFKVIYGTEAYLVDDLQSLVENSKNQSLDGTFVVFDLETTGFSPFTKIIEIGHTCGRMEKSQTDSAHSEIQKFRFHFGSKN